jgi:hypothetical protein
MLTVDFKLTATRGTLIAFFGGVASTEEHAEHRGDELLADLIANNAASVDADSMALAECNRYASLTRQFNAFERR